MRRMVDGWVNATHILKVAGFDKPQRTRILEREVQRGTHEKVQGGYGKYQGTWVPLERAKEIANQYEVTESLSPIFDYEPSENSPPPAPKHVSKPKSGARTASARMDSSPLPAPKKARKVATTGSAKNASQSQEKRGRGRPPNSSNTSSQLQHSQTQPLVQQQVAMPNFEDAGEAFSADSASVSSRSSSPSEGFLSDNELDEINGYPKRNDMDEYNSVALSMQNRQFLDSDMIAAEYSNKLLDYFMAPDDEKVPDFLIHPPEGFRITQVIDDEGHTAFHWACSMGILKIIEVLMEAGADIHATNLVGQTPLMRSVMFTNCFDRRTFPRIVELLRDTIFYSNPERRTILHHIAATTSSRSKLSSTRYYTEIILAKLSETQPMHDLSAFLDRQDVNGDTALHIAARHQARKLCKVLLSYHASTSIPNKSGITSYDILIQDNTMRRYLEADSHYQAQLKSSSSPTLGSGGGVVGASAVVQPTQQDGTGNNKQNGGSSQNITTPHSHHHHHQLNANGTDQMNGFGNGHIAYPHVAESAIKATQQVAPQMAEQFEALATAYDLEIKEKDSDMEQVQHLLTEMNADIANVEENIRVQEKHIGEESVVRQRLSEGAEQVKMRSLQLQKIVERTQARDLASLVQEEESKIDSSMVNGQHDSQEEIAALVQQLRALQNQRKELVSDITQLYAKAGVGEKMNDYRRLLATSCGVGIEQIDGMLDSIAQALTEDHQNDVEEEEAAAEEAQKEKDVHNNGNGSSATNTNNTAEAISV